MTASTTSRKRSPRPAPAGSETIRYASGPTALGTAYLFLSERGICALRIMERGEEAAELPQMQKQFDRATFIHDATAVAPAMLQVQEYLRGERDDVDIPLDMRGTPFFREVWKAMRRIPAGKTCSYQELARRAGRPKAVRAAAQACARNPIGILVPCHRVIKSDGGIGGYGGGLDLKRKLLDWEREGHASE